MVVYVQVAAYTHNKYSCYGIVLVIAVVVTCMFACVPSIVKLLWQIVMFVSCMSLLTACINYNVTMGVSLFLCV